MFPWYALRPARYVEEFFALSVALVYLHDFVA